jgi:hypothetical protein
VSAQTAIEDARRRLEKKINNFHKNGDTYMGDTYMGASEFDEDFPLEGGENWVGLDEWEEDEEKDSDEEGTEEHTRQGVSQTEKGEPERVAICLPSALGKARVATLGLQVLASQEMELRKGQANDALAALRIELGHKALLFRTKVRQSSNTKGKTRAWANIRVSSMEVMRHVRSYKRARQALEALGADEAVLEKYKDIEKGDLKMSSDMVEENRVGQRNDALAWFWRLGQAETAGDGWMEECKSISIGGSSYTNIYWDFM